jgi:chromosome partitioning protein
MRLRTEQQGERDITMHIVAIANSKGGSGKSTLGINLAVAAYLSGMKVLLIDCDPQRSVMDWAEMRSQTEPKVVAHELRDLPSVFAKARKENYDLVLVDVAGRDNAALYGLFRLADFVLVPTAPFNVELRVTKTVRRMVHGAGRQSRIVLVRTTDPQVRRTRSAIEDHPEHFAPVALRYLVAYPDSYARGEGVQEAFPESVAAAEVGALFDYMVQQVSGGAHG